MSAIVPYVAPLAARAIASSTPANLTRAATLIQKTFRGYGYARSLRLDPFWGYFRNNLQEILHYRRKDKQKQDSMRMTYAQKRRAASNKARAKRIQNARKQQSRWRRKYMNKKRASPPQARRIGYSRNHGASLSRTVIDLPTAVVQTRTLYIYPVTEIPKINVNDIDSPHVRKRDITFIKGFRMCLQLQNTRENLLLYNYAIIVPKAQQNVTTQDFFRSRKNTERGQDFDPAQLDSNDFHCSPINTDRYMVLAHKRYKLGATGATNPPKFKFFDRYFKINRQLRYDEGSNVPLYHPIYVVMWFDEVMNNAGVNPISGMRRNLNIKTYFSEPGTNI